ncbi:MAG: hypothetical protein Q8P11_02185 [bacterium]|nr:hypothetical protein [bacterium]
MKHIWSVLCQKTIIDGNSNLLSIIDCVEEINFTIKNATGDKIVIPIEFQIINFWTTEKDDSILNLKIDLIDPDKNIINDLSSTFDINKGAMRYRSITKIQGMPITKTGRYTFRISTQSNEKDIYNVISELPLDIKINAEKLLSAHT